MDTRPLAELIADTFIGHDVSLQRLTAGERRVIFEMLGKLQKELLDKLSASDIDEKSPFQQRRIKALLSTVETMILTRYKKIAEIQTERLVRIAETVSAQTVTLINAHIGAPLLTVGAPIEVLKALANDTIVLGHPAKEWWGNRLRDNLRGRFQQTIRQGIFAGETLSQLKQRVRGTETKRFQDGIMSASSREAEGLIRTSVQSVANAARYETFQANADVLAGQQWLSVLDVHTSEQCMALSGQAWDLEGNPIGDTTQPFPGPPPAHWNCRSTLVPVLKSWEQLIRDANGNEKLGRKLDRVEAKLGKGKQASMTGSVAARFTFTDWFKRRSVTEQKEILGPGKWELWNKGKIELTDLVDQRGRPFTLEELKASVA